MQGFVDPASQGAISVDLNSGHVLEEEAEIFNHEVFPGCLWSAHTALVVAARCDHVARRTVGRSAYHFPNKVHLPCSNHVSDTGDGIEHATYFVVAKVLVSYVGHRDMQDASYAAVEEYFKLAQVRFPQRPGFGSPQE
jgi:hypothetical protein